MIQEEQERTAQSEERQSFGASDVLRIVLEAVVLYIGASFLVEFGPKLARSFGVPEVIISLTFVALGTSLPEMCIRDRIRIWKRPVKYFRCQMAVIWSWKAEAALRKLRYKKGRQWR